MDEEVEADSAQDGLLEWLAACMVNAARWDWAQAQLDGDVRGGRDPADYERALQAAQALLEREQVELFERFPRAYAKRRGRGPGIDAEREVP